MAAACSPPPLTPQWPDYHNPCVIDDTSATLAPQHNKMCSSDFAGYIGQVIGDRQVRTKSNGNVGVSLWNGWRPFSDWNGLRRNDENYVAISECSSFCVRHPDCTSFAFRSRNGQTSTRHWKGGSWRRDSGYDSDSEVGKCYLYRYCDYKATTSYSGTSQWWLGSGSKDSSSSSSNDSRCIDRSHQTKHCKNDGTCICPAGYEAAPSTTDAVCAVCKWGSYKSGTNRNKCSAWSKPQTGEYIATHGSLITDHVMADCVNKPANSVYVGGGVYPRMDEIFQEDVPETMDWNGASLHNRRRLGPGLPGHTHPTFQMGMSGMSDMSSTGSAPCSSDPSICPSGFHCMPGSMSDANGCMDNSMMNMDYGATDQAVVKDRVIGKGTCPFRCNLGFMKSNKDGSAEWSADGTDCFKPGSTVTFKSSGSVGKVMSHANNVLSFHGFKCVDEPKFCGVDSSLSLFEKRIKELEEKVAKLGD